MSIQRRALLFTALFLLLVPGCKDRQSVPANRFEDHPLYRNYRFSDDERTIEIGVPTPWAAVSHIVEVMKRDEVLKRDLGRLGCTVVFHPFLKGEEINYFLKKGQLEGAIMGDVPTIRMAAEGQVTVLSLFHRGSVSLVSRDYYRVRDLKRRRVAFPYGSIAHYYLLRVLEEKGLTYGDITAVPMDTNKMFEAIEGGDVDALTTFEPTATVFTKIDPTLHTINRSFSSYGFFSLRTAYAARHRREAEALIAAQFRAMAWLDASDRHVDRASRWVAGESAKILDLPLKKFVPTLDALCTEDLLDDIVVYKELLNRAVLADDGAIRQEFDFLRKQGLLPEERTWREVKARFDTRELRRVMNALRPAAARIGP